MTVSRCLFPKNDWSTNHLTDWLRDWLTDIPTEMVALWLDRLPDILALMWLRCFSHRSETVWQILQLTAKATQRACFVQVKANFQEQLGDHFQFRKAMCYLKIMVSKAISRFWQANTVSDIVTFQIFYRLKSRSRYNFCNVIGWQTWKSINLFYTILEDGDFKWTDSSTDWLT